MKNLTLIFLIFGMLVFSKNALIAVPAIGEIPPIITLQGQTGGRVNGEAWSSSELKDKVYCVFYVDPDESDVNKVMETTLKEAGFPDDKYATVAVINMEATWLPNFAISTKLKGAQEDYPNTIYVKDMDKVLVKQWGLKDNSYDTIVFAPDGRVVYSLEGVFSESDVNEMIQIIRDVLPK